MKFVHYIRFRIHIITYCVTSDTTGRLQCFVLTTLASAVLTVHFQIPAEMTKTFCQYKFEVSLFLYLLHVTINRLFLYLHVSINHQSIIKIKNNGSFLIIMCLILDGLNTGNIFSFFGFWWFHKCLISSVISIGIYVV